MDGTENSSVGTSPSEGQGAPSAPAVASDGVGGTPAVAEGQPSAPAVPQASPQLEGDAAVTTEQQPVDQIDPAQSQQGEIAIPQLRAHANALEADLNGIRGELQQLGGIDQVKSDVSLVNALFSSDPVDFWTAIHSQSPDTTRAVVDAAIDGWSDYIVQKLQDRGLMPQAATPTSYQSQSVDTAELSGIDSKYHDVYKTLPASERYALQAEDAEVRDFRLGQFQKSFEHDQMLQQQQQAISQQQESAKQAQQQKIATDFRTAVWTGIQNQLADKLKPTGDAATDQQLGEVLRLWAEVAISQDPASQATLSQLYDSVERMETRKAMGLAAPVQAHAARLIGGVLEKLAPVFDGYHKYQKLQQSNGNNRVEPPAPGVTHPGQNQGQLPAGAGEFNPDNLLRYSREIFGS